MHFTLKATTKWRVFFKRWYEWHGILTIGNDADEGRAIFLFIEDFFYLDAEDKVKSIAFNVGSSIAEAITMVCFIFVISSLNEII